jgi:hypothetical protein
MLNQLASQYGCEDLARLCEGYLCNHVDNSNFSDLIQYADFIGLETLKTACITSYLRFKSSSISDPSSNLKNSNQKLLDPEAELIIQQFLARSTHVHCYDFSSS